MNIWIIGKNLVNFITYKKRYLKTLKHGRYY